MAKYIDKAAVVAEIEKRYETNIIGAHSAFRNGKIEALREVKTLINTLEVKEVEEEPVSNDLEEAAHQYAWDKQEHHIDFDGDEYLDYGVRFDAFKTGAKWQKEQTVKGVDLEKELIIWHRLHFKKEGTFEKYGGFYLANSSQLDLAKYFFELGLKAQQKGG